MNHYRYRDWVGFIIYVDIEQKRLSTRYATLWGTIPPPLRSPIRGKMVTVVGLNAGRSLERNSGTVRRWPQTCWKYLTRKNTESSCLEANIRWVYWINWKVVVQWCLRIRPFLPRDPLNPSLIERRCTNTQRALTSAFLTLRFKGESTTRGRESTREGFRVFLTLRRGRQG